MNRKRGFYICRMCSGIHADSGYADYPEHDPAWTPYTPKRVIDYYYSDRDTDYTIHGAPLDWYERYLAALEEAKRE